MKFSDGVSFETSGSMRVEHEFDGYYVVGNGMFIPVGSYQEGLDLITAITSRKN